MARKIGNWSLGAVVVAAIATILLLVTLLSKPSFVVMGHTVLITQGIMAGLLLFGAAFWLVIEVFTPPGDGAWDVIWRSLLGFLLGGLFGGLMAYSFNFGAYLINPAISGGNFFAVYELIAIIFAGIVLIWDAAWSHSRRFVRA